MMGAMLVRHEPASAAVVRREIALDLDLHGVGEDAVHDVALVATELVGNAVRHGASATDPDASWTVAWSIGPDEILISVEDPNDELPVVRHAAPDAPSGRGLAIVSALSSEWGVEPTDRGKRVWAKVRVA
jgi:anti-sigma regulatory factor (Ser/Thr protein kinase)